MRSLEKLIVLVAILLAAGCTGQEERVLDMFFTAVQEGNEDAIGRISLAEFTARVDSWELLEIGAESQSPFSLRELYASLEKKERELRIESQRNAHFANDHRSVFEEHQRRHKEDPARKFTGELGEFQAAWQERMARQGALEKEVEALEEQLKALRSVAGLSVNTPVNENFVGDVKTKNVHVQVNDGSGQKTYRIQLERYDLVDQERNLTPIANWIIAKIDEA